MLILHKDIGGKGSYDPVRTPTRQDHPVVGAATDEDHHRQLSRQGGRTTLQRCLLVKVANHVETTSRLSRRQEDPVMSAMEKAEIAQTEDRLAYNMEKLPTTQVAMVSTLGKH